MRTTILLIFAISCWTCFYSQSPFTLSKIDSVQVNADEFTVDAIGYIYTAEKDIIEKRDTSLHLLFRQSVKMTGQITTIDVTNPLKPLLFFLPQQSILFIDNTLTPYQNLGSLSNLGVSYATLVCYSEQFNRFWVYDQDNSQLILFDNDGKKIRNTENLSGLIGVVNPVQLLEKNGILFLVDENRGVYLFDMFGTLINFFEISNLEWIQADENNLYYILEDKIYSRNIKFNTDFTVAMPSNYLPKFRISKDLFYFKKGNQIDVFQINLTKKER